MYLSYLLDFAMAKLNRRELMKNVGTSIAGITALGTGTASASHNHNENDGRLYIRIWPQRNSDWDEAKNEIHDALVSFMNQTAVETWSVVYGDVTLKEEFGITYGDGGDCDYGSWWNDFKNSVSDRQGDVHIAVTDQTNFANAAPTEAWDGGEPGYAFVGTRGGYSYTAEDTKRYMNLAIQEVGHAIINEDRIPNSENLDHPEHALGKVRSDGKSTPMVTFYETDPDTNPCANLGEESSNGECSSTYDWDKTHTHKVTSCTKEAVKKTLNYDGY